MADDAPDSSDMHVDQRAPPADHPIGAWIFTVTAVLMAVSLFVQALLAGTVTDREVLIAGLLVAVLLNPYWTVRRVRKVAAADRSAFALSLYAGMVYAVVVLGLKLVFDFPGFDGYRLLWETADVAALVMVQAGVLAVVHYAVTRPLVPELHGQAARDFYLTNRWRFGQLLLAGGIGILVMLGIAYPPSAAGQTGRIRFIVLTAPFGWGFLLVFVLLYYKTELIERESIR